MRFSEWLAQELVNRGMKPQHLATAGDIDPATLSAILGERREVGPDVARRIALGLKLEQWEVFYAAGMLTEAPKASGQGSPLMVSIVRELSKCTERELRLYLAWFRVTSREIKSWEDFADATTPP